MVCVFDAIQNFGVQVQRRADAGARDGVKHRDPWLCLPVDIVGDVAQHRHDLQADHLGGTMDVDVQRGSVGIAPRSSDSSSSTP